MVKKILISTLLIIFFLGLVERTVGIISQNILFLFDNGRDLLYVKKIVVDHKILLLGPSSGGLQGYFHGVLWYYLLAIPFLLGGGNPLTFTLFMAILSSFSVLTSFWMMKKISNIYSAIIVATFFAFSEFSTATALFIWNPYPIVWLMPFYIFSLYAFVHKKKYALPLAAILVGFIFHFEAIYGITLIPVLFILFVIYIKQKVTYKKKILYLLMSFLLFLLPLFPTLAFDLRHHFLVSSALLKTFTQGGANISHDSNQKPKEISERIALRFNDLYTYSIQSVTPNKYINSLFFLLALAGLYYLIKRRDAKELEFVALCVTSLLMPFFIFLNLKYAVWGYYWIGNPPLYVFLISYIFGLVLVRFIRKRIPFIFLLIIILILVFNPFRYISLWQKGVLEQGSDNFSTQLHIVNAIYADAKKNNFSAYVLTPPVYDYVYRYLFWWRGKQLHLETKRDVKQKLIYFIREPKFSQKDGVFFKEHTIKTKSPPVKIIRFPGGIIVEKIFISSQENPVDQNYFPPL